MGRHAVLEADRPFAPAALAPVPVLPVPVLPVPLLPATALPATGFPRPAWVPPGYDAPPAGLDGPLSGPPAAWMPPRGCAVAPARVPRRTTLAAVVGAVGAGVALLATGATALGALAHTAGPAGATAPTSAVSSTAEQCSDAVAEQLDDTAAALGSGSRGTWASTVASGSSSIAATYGTDSAEHAAYAAGAAEILDWLRDPTATETYQDVVDRIVPTVVATCDRVRG